MLDADVSLTWMFECLQTEIHPSHELPALKEVLLGPGVHLVQGLAGDEPQQPGTQFLPPPHLVSSSPDNVPGGSDSLQGLELAREVEHGLGDL